MDSASSLPQSTTDRQLVGPQPRGRGTKVRCDGKRPVCGTCENSNRPSECSWSKDGTPLRKRTNEAFVESLKKRNDALSEYTAFLESLVERCRRDHGGTADSAYLHRRPDDIEIPLDDVDPTDYGGQEDEPMDVENHSIHGLIAPIQRLTLLEGGGLITYGSTSVFRFRPINIQNVPSRFPAIMENPDETYVLLLDGVDESHYNPDLDWARYLPNAVPLDRRGHDKALDLLFKFLTSWCLRVVPPLFLRDMVRALSVPKGQTPPKTTHYSPMLHNALLALGLSFLDDPAVRDYKARQYFAEEAKKHIEAECSKPNLCSANALAIIATFHSSQGDQTLGFMYFGMAARMSQALGLDVDCSEWVKLGLIEETDVLDRYWTYWTTFAQDVNWSLYVGRDFCVRAPSESEFRDMPVPFVDSELDQLPFTHPGVPTQPNFLSKTFATTCELLVIARRIMNVVNGINKTRARQSVIDEMITDIDLQLNTWKSSLHPDVDLTPKNKFAATPHKLMLHMAYWWQFILLHRPYLHRCPKVIHSSDKAIDHYKLCRRAAEHIMDLLAVWRQLYTLRYCPITLVQPLFAAGTIFLLSGVQATSGIRVAQKELKTCVDSIKLLMQYLREIGKSWQCALNIESILRALVEEQLKPAIEKRQSAVPKDRLTGPETEREKYRTIPPVRRPSARRERPRQGSNPSTNSRSRSMTSSEHQSPTKLGSPTISVHPVLEPDVRLEGSFGQPPMGSSDLLTPWGSQQLSAPVESPLISTRMPPSPALSTGSRQSLPLNPSSPSLSFYDSNNVNVGLVSQSPVQSMISGSFDQEALFGDMTAVGGGEAVTNFDYNNFEMARFLAMPSGNNLSGVPFVGPFTIEEYIGSLQEIPGDTSPDGIFDFSMFGADFNAEASGSGFNGAAGTQFLSGGSPIGLNTTINHHRRAVSADSRPARMGGSFNGHGFLDYPSPFA
ncbi:hypothetical protein EST38_g4998 [Candolleomyces aberdarensis]|uniref:Xylanolytic transcriptional activator regulatory domain-containing protein n=1 Tax=Candolleomyces aberdarensis TaxID=2316362 RepID=A0A4Q2DNE0_9AGAR|nr:hypothetical protein EST38_g4998 [Candolleomyces aberdarensis]